MKHQHYDLIVAWADGAQIQWLSIINCQWEDVDMNGKEWHEHYQYRIKPRRRPDLYKYVDVRAVTDGICQWTTCLPDEANLGLIFDGETKQLKAAEVLK
jgi:hypothetical protein